ncbi:MAG TPA: NUDIX hydrolase [Candidatus Baltobacteraceae bacterium]|nr:NUDIX hydrolase [Candidatus Baltobacteraceae bacterium]
MSVLLFRGERILLIRHRRDTRFYWVLPGGGVEVGEGVIAAAERELREEAGLTVEIVRLFYIGEVISPDGKKHVLDLIFLGEAQDHQPLRASQQWQMEEPHFVPLEDLPSLAFYPPIATQIIEDFQAGWRTPFRFLGNLWRNMDDAWEWPGPERLEQ